MPRRLHRLVQTTTPQGPAWFVRLHQALFARLPQAEDAFELEGTSYLCRRALTEDGAKLVFQEALLDPHQLTVQLAWRAEIEAGAFVGPIPAKVFEQSVDVLVQGLLRQRPITVRRERARPPQFTRFAHQPAQRRG